MEGEGGLRFWFFFFFFFFFFLMGKYVLDFGCECLGNIDDVNGNVNVCVLDLKNSKPICTRVTSLWVKKGLRFGSNLGSNFGSNLN